MVATQLVEIPKVPYFHPYENNSLPDIVIAEAEALTAKTCANLPPIAEQLQNVIRLLHQLGICYTNKEAAGSKIDDHIIQPLYDAEYAILRLLSSHKESPHLSDVELLLVETFQLYFWTGPRSLPPQTRLCDLLISRIIKALLVLVLEKVPAECEYEPIMARGFQPTHPDGINTINKTLHHPLQTNNAIVWSLALGTIVSQALQRPEYLWLHGHYKLYRQAMGLDRKKDEYEALLRLFPTTEVFPWLDLRSLHAIVDTPMNGRT